MKILAAQSVRSNLGLNVRRGRRGLRNGKIQPQIALSPAFVRRKSWRPSNPATRPRGGCGQPLFRPLLGPLTRTPGKINLNHWIQASHGLDSSTIRREISGARIMAKKYRHGKVKRQHHVLTYLEDGLKLLSSLPTVDGVIPGTIRPKSGGSLGFTFQYLTHSGFKLIGRSSGAAQEVFVITQNPRETLADLHEAGLLPTLPILPADGP